MGADTTSTHLIFFIAATVIAVSASGIFAGVVMDISHKLDVKGEAFGEQLTTSIKISNDPGQVPNNPVIIYVKNTGQSTLNAEQVTLILNGEVRTTTYEVLENSGSELWRPGEMLKITYQDNLATGDHRVRVLTENGVHDDMKFRV